VLCPGYNDGAELMRTIRELSELGPEVLSLAIVPVGLTRFRQSCAPLRTFSPAESAAIVDAVAGWQAKFRAANGNSFVYLSDEFYLRAGREIPAEENYDGYPQLENGIGLVRSFLTDWWEAGGCEALKPVSAIGGDPVVAVSGTAFAPVLSGLLQPLSPAVRVAAVVNDFFGRPSMSAACSPVGTSRHISVRWLCRQS
jgi:hypothetical protein